MADPAAIEKLLSGSVFSGGLWFDDPACAAKFGAPQEIMPDRFGAFARCLGGLHLQASPRADALPFVLVLTYAPGFEIEARVTDEWPGPRLAWIGYESRSSADPLIATISVATLEAHRLAGDPTGPVDAALGSSWAWLKVCVDAEGAVTIQPREVNSGPALQAFTDATAAWKFRPFVVHDRAIPVCAMVSLASPPEGPDAVETLPIPSASSQPVLGPRTVTPTALQRPVAGKTLLAPEDDTKVEIQQSGRTRIVGTFKVCIDATGHVDTITPVQLTGFPAYDRTIVTGIRQWVYPPYLAGGQPTPVCTVVSFIYAQH